MLGFCCVPHLHIHGNFITNFIVMQARPKGSHTIREFAHSCNPKKRNKKKRRILSIESHWAAVVSGAQIDTTMLTECARAHSPKNQISINQDRHRDWGHSRAQKPRLPKIYDYYTKTVARANASEFFGREICGSSISLGPPLPRRL